LFLGAPSKKAVSANDATAERTVTLLDSNTMAAELVIWGKTALNVEISSIRSMFSQFTRIAGHCAEQLLGYEGLHRFSDEI
jgi:hypothetical protein